MSLKKHTLLSVRNFNFQQSLVIDIFLTLNLYFTLSDLQYERKLIRFLLRKQSFQKKVFSTKRAVDKKHPIASSSYKYEFVVIRYGPSSLLSGIK